MPQSLDRKAHFEKFFYRALNSNTEWALAGLLPLMPQTSDDGTAFWLQEAIAFDSGAAKDVAALCQRAGAAGEAALPWWTVLANYAGDKISFDDYCRYAKPWSDHVTVRRVYAWGLFNASLHAKSDSLEDPIIQELKRVHNFDPADAATRAIYAKGLFSASLDANSASLEDPIIQELQKVHGIDASDLGTLELWLRALARLVFEMESSDAWPEFVRIMQIAISRPDESETLDELVDRILSYIEALTANPQQ